MLFGPSGSGKTLTLDCIAGFARPDAGRILLDDRHPVTMAMPACRSASTAAATAVTCSRTTRCFPT